MQTPLTQYLLVAALSAGSACAAHAQTAAPDAGIPCPPPHAPLRCVDLDASRSVDAQSGSLTYVWDMGDGTSSTGPIVSHCYAKRGKYIIQLDVVEPSGYVRVAEKVIPVDFTQDDVLNFQSPTTVRVGESVAFDALDSELAVCENVNVVWDFRDGLSKTGRQVEHVFRKPGRYAVRMSLRGTGPGACPDSHCVAREVEVLP